MRRLLQQSENSTTEQLLKDNMPKLHELAKYLYEKETITGDEFMEILNLSPDQLTTTRMETN